MTKKTKKVRVGLVELHVSPPAGAPRDKFAALARTVLAERAARARSVSRVLRHVQTQRLDVLLFPGWTLAGEALPKSVLSACGDRVVVLEGVGAATGKSTARYPWTTYVVWRGAVVAKARQLLATAAEVDEETARRLAEELASSRTFVHPTLGRTGLLVCGEPNVVREHAPSTLPELDTILNPAHTPSVLPAMQRKRARLAARGALFTTANTYDGWAPREGRPHAASRRAAEWFRRGVRGARPDPVELAPDARLSIVEL